MQVFSIDWWWGEIMNWKLTQIKFRQSGIVKNVKRNLMMDINFDSIFLKHMLIPKKILLVDFDMWYLCELNFLIIMMNICAQLITNLLTSVKYDSKNSAIYKALLITLDIIIQIGTQIGHIILNNWNLQI